MGQTAAAGAPGDDVETAGAVAIGGGLVAVNPVSLARLLNARGPFQGPSLAAADQ